MEVIAAIGNNAWNSTKKYDAARAKENELDQMYEQIAANLERMRSTYSQELAGENYGSELAARDSAINNMGAARDKSTEGFLQNMARAGIGSSGNNSTDVGARGFGQIANNYQSGVSGLEQQLVDAAQSRKRSVEEAMMNYELEANQQTAGVKSELSGLKDSLRSTQFGANSNIMENLGNSLMEQPGLLSGLANGVMGQMGDSFNPGEGDWNPFDNMDMGEISRQAGIGVTDDFNKNLGIDPSKYKKGVIDSGMEKRGGLDVPYTVTMNKDGTKSKKYDYDKAINITGSTTTNKTPDPLTQAGKATKGVQAIVGDRAWKAMTGEQRSRAINNYIRTGGRDTGVEFDDGGYAGKQSVTVADVGSGGSNEDFNIGM